MTASAPTLTTAPALGLGARTESRRAAWLGLALGLLALVLAVPAEPDAACAALAAPSRAASALTFAALDAADAVSEAFA